ncbi:uncharacterized protein A1O9_00593 [Exophiala aquamarina CBS 119918]|uniref:Tyrosine specific protein phosphatases domain-containing protein n=1 Tax=Exophiala aquamarina CBS 119918 TaxID=1182545 RepID=A0A072Q3Y2_9EURO|nr:uncharacterized protein A1O9_00593 [Exophiala aquamarina CBS 119918]KEF62620.1 hypothetical protein A1O9_00593 [Exophiala aquamarina CBS 119918]
MAVSITCGALLGAGALYFTYSYVSSPSRDQDEIVLEQQHPLLKDHLSTRSYTTQHATYNSIRTFYHAHVHAEKLQAIADLPLLVFIHGLGGSLPQFAPLLGSLVNIAPCFGIELPGHGSSDFSPKNYNAYTIEAFAGLWSVAIQDICREHGHQNVVIVAHSMGCSIAALLSTAEPSPVTVAGIIGICPKATPPSKSETVHARRLLSLPDVMLDLLRMVDRRGGINSSSVKRMAGEAAGIDLRRLQLGYNKSFRTPVWKRSTIGCLPQYSPTGEAVGGLPGKEVWAKIRVPLFLIAGEADTVTKPKEVDTIMSFLQSRNVESNAKLPTNDDTIPVSDGPLRAKAQNSSTETSFILDTASNLKTAPSASEARADDRQFGVAPSTRELSSHHSNIVKTAILPSPAAHALMYDHSTYRTVAGLIEDFLSRYVSPQLSLGWQLQQLTTAGKWDVKNLEKWKRVTPVSDLIGTDGIFRALKTLREQDEEHSPGEFLKKWRDRIFAIVDISHDSPVYDTKALERGGVQYHKFPTVSKVPPTPVEVQDFISLVDRLRSEEGHEGKAIGVHCHYGYNRTGFFIASYLIEKMGYRPQDAVDEFARAKPPGIRHDHFIDALFMRYHVGLKKAPTMNGTP